MGTPLPAARLYSLVEGLSEIALPVFQALIKTAAQGEVLQNDDTWVRVQSSMKDNKTAKKSGLTVKRKGMVTTGIYARVGAHRIAL